MGARVLVVEGYTPDHAEAQERATGLSPAENYGAALKAAAPDLTIEIARPYFPGYDPAAHDPADYDGMAVTGSGVGWTAADERAQPFWALYEKAFAAGRPVVGSCWGLQLGAVVLGGEVGAGPHGVEFDFARAVRHDGHPMHEGRRSAFDVICIHRDDVLTPPEGAVVTATNAHTRVQALAYERDGVSFWGVQYHPECTLAHVAHWHGVLDVPRASAAAASQILRIAADPAPNALLCAKHRIGVDILDRDYHATELNNWVRRKILV